MKIFLMILALSFTACSSIPKTTTLKREACFVRWQSQEDKDKFHKGKNLTRKERSEQRLMIPVFSNMVFVIEEIQESHYEVRGYMSLEDYEEFRSLVSKKIVLSEDIEKRIKELYMFSTKKIPKGVLEEKIKKEAYEEVECEKYQEAIYL